MLGASSVVINIMNGRLSREVGYFGASFVFLLIGAMVLLVLILLNPRQSGLVRIGAVPPYLFIPAVVNLAMIAWICLSYVWYGAVVTATISFLGQIVAGAVLDHIGFLELPVIKLDPARITGILLMFGGALLVQGLLHGKTTPPPLRPLQPHNQFSAAPGFRGAKFACPFFLGVAISLMITINASLGRYIGVLETAFLFLMPGAIMLFCYFRFHPRESVPILNKKIAPLYFIPGVVNIVVIGGLVKLVPLIGVSLATLSYFLGQSCIALVLDHHAFLGLTQSKVTGAKVMGIFLMVMGWIVVS